MRLRPLAALIVIAGCLGTPASPSGGEPCEAVFGPLFDPAGPAAPVSHKRVDLGVLDAPAGCRVLEDADDIRAALDGASGEAAQVDPTRERLVTLRASGAVPCFWVGQVYRLPNDAIVIETFTRDAGEGAECATVWGVGLARAGSNIIHAHDGP